MNLTGIRFRSFILAFLIYLAFFAAQGTTQQIEKGQSQTWLGTLVVPGAKLRLQLVVRRNNNSRLQAVMTSLDQNNAEIKIDTISIKDSKIHFEAKAARIVYQGEFADDSKTITGTFNQGGAKFDLDFDRVKDAEPLEHVESWRGMLKAGPKEFDFQLRVFKSKKGEWSGKLDSFSENLFGLHLDYRIEGDSVKFDLPLTKAKFEGTLNEDRSEIKGTWIQRGNELPLNFKKIALKETREPKVARPQTPKPPFPYDSKEVAYDNREAGVTLGGTLTIPKGDGPFPAVILISGSGQQDRNSTIANHQPFWVLADALTRSGIAVLRYDERGIGKSTGDFSKVNSLDLSGDVEAGIRFLKSEKRVDAEKIGLIGHSEGGYIAPMIAARNRDVDFIVMLAGPAVPGKQIVLNQSRLIMNSMGAKKDQVDLSIQFSTALFEQLEKSAGQDDLMKQLQSRFDTFTNGLEENRRKALGDLKQQRAGMAQMATPWFQFFAIHDPRTDLRKVTCPVLALNGTVDLQVDADLNLPEIEKALKQAGNKDFTIRRLEKLNHLFQKSETGRIDEYATLSETFNKDALKIVVDWVVEKTR